MIKNWTKQCTYGFVRKLSFQGEKLLLTKNQLKIFEKNFRHLFSQKISANIKYLIAMKRGCTFVYCLKKLLQHPSKNQLRVARS